MANRKDARKLGLALSGGGFRAAFFHVGVLAQMAMLGLLRHVEVISTVSGGSIVGALYYLHAKRLLESKADNQITDQDYKELVEHIEMDFLKAVQRNIRMRTFLNPLKNMRMAMANYSRSDRIGELYDKYLYRPVMDADHRVQMRELKIKPKGDAPEFHPDVGNATRSAKVPVLLINATTLNTGHNWRFEASRMGEPPRAAGVAAEVDKNMRLRRPPSYEAITVKQQDIELGLAVAASACVPAIFHPLAISDLYPEGIRVQLVDGGVHDNQGIEGLLDRRCTCFVVSDASGQMEDECDPATGIASVLSRSNDVLMDRVREEELFRAFDRSATKIAFMHLRKGLSATAQSWIGADGQPTEKIKVERQSASLSETFGVSHEVQYLLSRVRTDLDSFTAVEAQSLMLDGYLMSAKELKRPTAINELIPEEATVDEPHWQFLSIGTWIVAPNAAYSRQLQVASEQLFKIFRLSPVTTALTSVVVIMLLALLFALFKDRIYSFLSASWTVGQLLIAGIVLCLGFIPRLSRIFTMLRFLRAPSEFVIRLLTRALLPAVGSLFVWIHLIIFNRLFLHHGRVKRLSPPSS